MVLVAKILLVLEIVVAAAAIGAAVAFLGYILIGTITGVDDMNGALAMGAVSIIPIGGLVGASLGAWYARRLIGRLRIPAILAGGYAIVALVALSAGGWFLYQELASGNPYEPGSEPVVSVEWRLPDIVDHAQAYNTYRHAMRSTAIDWSLATHWDEPRMRDEAGHTILRFRGEIRWRRDGRIFQLWQAPDHDDRITVELGLPRDPQPTPDYTAWQSASDQPGYAFRTRILAE